MINDTVFLVSESGPRANSARGRLRATYQAAQKLAEDRSFGRDALQVTPITIVTPPGSVFIVKINSDRTEGRGHLVDLARFDNLPAAIEAAEGEGVMGVSDADIYLAGDPNTVSVFSSAKQWRKQRDNARNTPADIKLYDSYGGLALAYLKPQGEPSLPALIEDADYQAYLKLQQRFGALR